MFYLFLAPAILLATYNVQSTVIKFTMLKVACKKKVGKIERVVKAVRPKPHPIRRIG
jgi:hypothetical protein